MEHIELSIDDLLEVTLKQDDDFLKVKRNTYTHRGILSPRE